MSKRIAQIATSIRVLVNQNEKYVKSCSIYDETEQKILLDFLEVLKIFYQQKDPIENSIYRENLAKGIDQFLIKNHLFFMEKQLPRNYYLFVHNRLLHLKIP